MEFIFRSELGSRLTLYDSDLEAAIIQLSKVVINPEEYNLILDGEEFDPVSFKLERLNELLKEMLADLKTYSAKREKAAWERAYMNAGVISLLLMGIERELNEIV
jgi:hypothetical protein